MEEKDITLADMILSSLMSESEHIMLYVIHEKATDEAQAQRVILSLCSYGAAHETDIRLEKTDKTANLIALGGARYIYEQECLKERYNKLSMLDIELSIQQIIDLPSLANERARMARDCFLLSFALMGMNSADLLTCPPARKDEIVYFRQKTASRRTDRAEMHVRIEPCVSPLIARYSDKTGKRLLHFYLRYKDRVSFNKAINKGLKDVGEAIGVDGLTFYAAWHSWATIARTPREEGGAGLDKYVIHEALNHVDTSMKVTDIYLVKNWRVIFDANKAVMNLFDWSGIGK